MNQFIINPVNGEKVSILSKQGLRLLKTYIMAFKYGGSESAAAAAKPYEFINISEGNLPSGK